MRTLFLPAIFGVVSGSAQPVPPHLPSPAMALVLADSKPFIFGEVLQLNSTVLGQDRVLNVHLPEGYSPDSSTTYPVIYVLDGSANEDFPHIAGLAQFMNMYDLLPKSIVVGVANKGPSRYHDFTSPSKVDSDMVWIPTNGGSAAFIDFLRQEVQPLVNQRYKVNGTRMVIGQSLGGLLCAEILFKRPELFDDYVIVSPSFWWDNGSLANGSEAWVRDHSTLQKKIFLAMAHDDDMMQPQMDKLVAALKTYAKAPLQWTYVPFPEESHATILHRAVYRGFEWLTSGK
ncbi:MAG: alpha/beta hydrolase [Flavobacteriales bacterium]|nr:alpha/beta hydrolase [Flavobacteriales bacterium]